LAAGQGPVIRHTAPGRSFTLKLQNGETNESVMMFEEVAPVGTVTNFHSHRESDEIAYVLSGEITFKIGDQVTVGGPGTCAFLPRDVPHAWKSTGAEAARVLFLYTPGRAGKMFEELLDRPHRLDERTGERANARAARHGVCRPTAFLSRRRLHHSARRATRASKVLRVARGALVPRSSAA
jgi:quercetin dioxygenase-like cupin family protein